MNIVGMIIKQIDFDIDFDDILDLIAKRSPGLAFLIAAVIGIGGMAIVGLFFWKYMGN